MSFPELCLNMIVRNEAAILGRSLRSVCDHIDYWVICDTGSADETKEFVREFFAARKIPGELHEFEFENFSASRNRAMDIANNSHGRFDYLLLMDADMALTVEDPDFRQALLAPAYRVLQKSGSLSYWNTRLLHRNAAARYHGVTHEYLDRLPDERAIDSVWFRDYADGANRPGKLERDSELLLKGLAEEPSNARYMFYLAQSYRDAGRFAEAAETYAARVNMGGWEEETWNAQLQEARCRLAIGDDSGFLSAVMKAYEMRPHRAETLYELAKFHRQRGAHDTAMHYCEAASRIPVPTQDSLFIEDFIYQTSIREEISISGYYSKMPIRQKAGRSMCFELALDRNAPETSRSLARHNQVFYARPGVELFPSLESWPLAFEAPAGGNIMNPSIAVRNGVTYVIARNVNYKITPEGRYDITGDGTIETRNYLLRLDSELRHPEACCEIRAPSNMPAPLYTWVRGFEDQRLFMWRGSFWCSATVRELNSDGICEVVLGRIDSPFSESCELADWRVLNPSGERRHQKNWMPLVESEELKFVYSSDPVRMVDDQGRLINKVDPKFELSHLRGGSQAIGFDGGWLMLTHEVAQFNEKRIYLHRFLWLDSSMREQRVSEPFYFEHLGIEFAAGLARHADTKRLVVSFGVHDARALIGTLLADEVRAALRSADSIAT
jgi:glycosyltransferase involved in cell wall biosynthesis